MVRKILLFLFTILVVALLMFYTSDFRSEKPSSVKIGNTSILVDVAKTPEERSLGLSYRKELGKNQGMLFTFPTKSYQTFWMKGMNFDLDFIWIANSKVVDITENVPSQQENVPDEALPVYQSKMPITSMLEVNSGFVVNNKIKVGDPVILNLEE